MPASPQEIYDAVVRLITAKVPGFEVRFKNESKAQRLLGVLSYPFNRNYVDGFTTTFYPHIYFPNREFVQRNLTEAWKTLAHEYVHLLDTKASPWGFRLRYLFPQILSILSFGTLFAFVSLWALLFLGFLVALVPWPSRGRTAAELRGYTMDLAVDFWPTRVPVTEAAKAEVAKNFTGWAYYRMCWSAQKIDTALDAVAVQLESNAILSGPGSGPYIDMLQLLQAQDVVAAKEG